MRPATRFAALAIAFVPGTAAASSSGWLDSEGGRVRIVTTGAVDATGLVHGALEVDLLPGWKTYWRDPGEAGVPPVIDLSQTPGTTLQEMRFPAPKRFDDGYSKWVGYKHSVALPLTFKLQSGEDGKPIDASVFIGICETICIPVQGELSVDPASDPDNAEDRAIVRAGVDALPGPGREDFGAAFAGLSQDSLLIEARAPGNPETMDFFLASGSGYVFGTPERGTKDGKLVFSVPVLDAPAAPPATASFPYTLTSGEEAVSGTIALP